MALSLTELNALTQEFIAPGVTDNVFLNDPLLAFLKANQPRRFPGGKTFDEMFMYGKENGGSYDHTSTSSTFTVTIKSIANRATHTVKHYYTNVSVLKPEIQVYNKGPEAAFRMIDMHMVNAALRLSELLALDLYNYGVDASGGAPFDSDGTDRSLKLNGLAEIVNDDVSDSWASDADGDGQAFQNYGTIDKRDVDDDGGGLNGNVTNVAGSITYKTLDEKYMEAVIGTEQPNLGVTTNLGYSYIKQKFQPLQRITSVDPNVGFTGLEFNNSRIMVSQYAPGTQAPGDNTSAEGEVLWFLNTKHFRLWITDDPEFAFGFSGFKGARNDDLLAGQIKFAGNISCVSPRLQAQLNQITG
jgi:hypothetical protein